MVVLMGVGWTSATERAVDLINTTVASQVAAQTAKCEEVLLAGNYELGYETCLPIIDMILEAAKINPYDRKLSCPPEFPLCTLVRSLSGLSLSCVVQVTTSPRKRTT